MWELRRALAQVAIHVPLVPSLVGSLSMLGSAYFGGGQALALTLGLTCVGILLWRVADGVADAMRDIAGGMFVALYPSFLAGFAALLLAAPDDGAKRVFVFILVTVLSDIGGYLFGVLWGRHPMAPSVSPKKSWEGFTVRSSPACGGVPGHPAGPRRALVERAHPRGPRRSRRDRRRPHGVDHQARPRDQGHEHDPPGPRRGHGPLDSLLITAPLTWALLSVFVPLA